MRHLSPQCPSGRQVCESTTSATFRSKSKNLHSCEQITFDDDDDEDKEEDTIPLIESQSKRGHL